MFELVSLVTEALQEHNIPPEKGPADDEAQQVHSKSLH